MRTGVSSFCWLISGKMRMGRVFAHLNENCAFRRFNHREGRGL